MQDEKFKEWIKSCHIFLGLQANTSLFQHVTALLDLGKFTHSSAIHQELSQLKTFTV